MQPPRPLASTRDVRRRTVLAAVVGTAATLLAGCTGTNAVDQGGGDTGYVTGPKSVHLIPLGKRSAPPTIAGTGLDGAKLTAASYRGKVVLVNFWAQWCPPCRAEAPGIQSAYRRYSGDGLQVLGVDVRDVRQLATAFVRNKDLTYPSIFDPRSRIALSLPAIPITTPSTLVLDRSGRVAVTYARALTGPQIDTIVARVLAEK